MIELFLTVSLYIWIMPDDAIRINDSDDPTTSCICAKMQWISPYFSFKTNDVKTVNDKSFFGNGQIETSFLHLRRRSPLITTLKSSLFKLHKSNSWKVGIWMNQTISWESLKLFVAKSVQSDFPWKLSIKLRFPLDDALSEESVKGNAIEEKNASRLVKKRCFWFSNFSHVALSRCFGQRRYSSSAVWPSSKAVLH